MRKMKLQLDALQVETFVAAPRDGGRGGTVRAHAYSDEAGACIDYQDPGNGGGGPIYTGPFWRSCYPGAAYPVC